MPIEPHEVLPMNCAERLIQAARCGAVRIGHDSKPSISRSVVIEDLARSVVRCSVGNDDLERHVEVLIESRLYCSLDVSPFVPHRHDDRYRRRDIPRRSASIGINHLSRFVNSIVKPGYVT